MLTYETDVKYFDDVEKERSRRVEIYRKQVEVIDYEHEKAMSRCKFGAYSKKVICDELSDRFPDGFPSITAAAEFMGTTRTQLRSLIRRSKDGVARYENYTFRFLKSCGITGKERRVRCLTDGITFPSLRKAREYAGVSGPAMCSALKKANGKPAIVVGKSWVYVEKDERQIKATSKSNSQIKYGVNQLFLFDVGELRGIKTPRRERRVARPFREAQLYFWRNEQETQ